MIETGLVEDVGNVAHPRERSNSFLSICQIDSDPRKIIPADRCMARQANNAPVIQTVNVFVKASSDDARGACNHCKFVLRHGKQASARPTVAMQMEGDNVGLWPSKKYISHSS